MSESSYHRQDYLRAVLGGILLSLWVAASQYMLFGALPSFDIYLAFLFLGLVVAAVFAYWRKIYLSKRTSESSETLRVRSIAGLPFVIILTLYFVLARVYLDQPMTFVAFISLSGASLGVFFLALRIPMFMGATPHRWGGLQVFLLGISALFAAIGIMSVLSYDESMWLGYFILMGISVVLTFYFGEPLASEPR